jgi:hypothetical protein
MLWVTHSRRRPVFIRTQTNGSGTYLLLVESLVTGYKRP